MEEYSNEANILTAVEKNNKTNPAENNHRSNTGSKLQKNPQIIEEMWEICS